MTSAAIMNVKSFFEIDNCLIKESQFQRKAKRSTREYKTMDFRHKGGSYSWKYDGVKGVENDSYSKVGCARVKEQKKIPNLKNAIKDNFLDYAEDEESTSHQLITTCYINPKFNRIKHF